MVSPCCFLCMYSTFRTQPPAFSTREKNKIWKEWRTIKTGEFVEYRHTPLTLRLWNRNEVSWDKRGQPQKGQSSKQTVAKAMRSGSTTVTAEKKFGSGGNPNAKNPATIGAVSAKKLEDGEDMVQVEKPTTEMRKLLQQERTKAGLTQAELAQMCNIKPQVISEYEQGKGIPNPVMLGKIERAIRAKNPELKFGTLTKAQKKGN